MSHVSPVLCTSLATLYIKWSEFGFLFERGRKIMGQADPKTKTFSPDWAYVLTFITANKDPAGESGDKPFLLKCSLMAESFITIHTEAYHGHKLTVPFPYIYIYIYIYIYSIYMSGHYKLWWRKATYLEEIKALLLNCVCSNPAVPLWSIDFGRLCWLHENSWGLVYGSKMWELWSFTRSPRHLIKMCLTEYWLCIGACQSGHV